MNILYTSFLTESDKFNKIYNESIVKPGQQVQKFNRLFAEGLAQNNYKITCLSTPPVSRATSSKLFVSGEKLTKDKITYNHIGFINIPILKQMIVLASGFFKCIIWALKKGDKVIICDTIAATLSSLVVFIGRLFNIKTVALVTDLPNFLDMTLEEKEKNSLMSKMYSKVSTNTLQNYDAYILLTQAMNNVINKSNKPYIVMEGMVDDKEIGSDNSLSEKLEPPVILYAGALFEKYGLKMLLDGFKMVKHSCQLYIYGDGEMKDEFKTASKNFDNIKFFGVAPNNEVVEMEKKANILINPRMSNQEFAKYSFPSKNMEYMMSGTPVITCNLPGMPKEYHSYVYILEKETKECLANKIDTLLDKDKENLHKLGLRSKKFVENNKTNVKQAKYVGKFIKDLING